MYFIYDALICVCQVTCVGQVIGVIVAETQAQAQRAAKMVKITYEELPRILTIEVKNAIYNAKCKFHFLRKTIFWDLTVAPFLNRRQ